LSNSPIYQSRFDTLKCCVLVPTYNNEKSLASVLQDLLLYTNNIVVVNDGSTDNTKEILSNFSNLNIFHFENNSGKGAALDHGFQKAEELGYEYAITIDSDGQHYPDDLQVFLDELEAKNPQDPEILLVGDRNMGRMGSREKALPGINFPIFGTWL
jgi:glycosyltransferase involved in cell wall biosynthesis